MAASLQPVLHVVRCPECGAALEPDGADAVACDTGHRFDLIAGRAPDLVRTVVQQDTPGQRAMRFRPLVSVYESIWRPLFTRLAGGTDPGAETDQLVTWLEPTPDAVVLDLACGPGNTTRRLAAGIADASVIGLDLSEPMLEEAVESTPDRAPSGSPGPMPTPCRSTTRPSTWRTAPLRCTCSAIPPPSSPRWRGSSAPGAGSSA